MLLNGRVKLEIANVTNWTNVPVTVDGNAFFVPSTWSWVDYTEGLLSIDISRGIDQYEGSWSQPSPGQLTIQSRNPDLNPQTNSQIAYGHKIRVLVDDEVIFTGKIRETDVQYSNFRDDPIVTIDSFDSWQSLLDYDFKNTKSVVIPVDGPQENFKDANVANLFSDAGFGPHFSYDWPLAYWTNSPPAGAVIFDTSGSFSLVRNDTKEFATWKIRDTKVLPYNPAREESRAVNVWWPDVYLEPYTFKSIGFGPESTNAVHRRLYALDHVAPTAQDLATLENYPLDTTRRNYENLSFLFRTQDYTYNPATGQYTNPSVQEYRYQYGDVLNNAKQVPVNYTEPWSMQNNHRFDISAPSSTVDGFYSQFVTESDRLVDNLLAFDQAEQGVIYTTKYDNFVAIPRSRLEINTTGAPRTNVIEFNSDGTTNSYYDIKVRDGLQSLVNKVIITNIYYDNNMTSDGLFEIEDWKRYDDNTTMFISRPTVGVCYSAAVVARSRAGSEKTITYEYIDAESIKRYGERVLNLETNYAWPIWEQLPGGSPLSTYRQIYHHGGAPPAVQPIPTDSALTPNSSWRYIEITRNTIDSEELAYRTTTAAGSVLPGQFSFKKNIPYQMDILGEKILEEYSLPQAKVQSIVWQPQTDEQILQAAQTEIFDYVDINHTAHGITINDNFRIMGMKHRIDPTSWEIEYQLWDEQGLP